MTRPHPALVDASPTSAWLDSPLRPVPRPALASDTTAHLVVVGGGYSGLWTAALAKERDPGRDVVLLEAQRIGCDFELTGSLSVATEPHQVAWLQEAGLAGQGEYLDREAIRAEVDSPTY